MAQNSNSDILMQQLEQKVGLLLTRYQRMQRQLASVTKEREGLRDSCAEKEQRIETLQQQLAMMRLAQPHTTLEGGGDQCGLISLREEVAGLSLIIDECITLLEQRIE